jgi:hypothetical protein
MKQTRCQPLVRIRNKRRRREERRSQSVTLLLLVLLLLLLFLLTKKIERKKKETKLVVIGFSLTTNTLGEQITFWRLQTDTTPICQSDFLNRKTLKYFMCFYIITDKWCITSRGTRRCATLLKKYGCVQTKILSQNRKFPDACAKCANKIKVVVLSAIF